MKARYCANQFKKGCRRSSPTMTRRFAFAPTNTERIRFGRIVESHGYSALGGAYRSCGNTPCNFSSTPRGKKYSLNPWNHTLYCQRVLLSIVSGCAIVRYCAPLNPSEVRNIEPWITRWLSTASTAACCISFWQRSNSRQSAL